MIRVQHKALAEYFSKRQSNLISLSEISAFDARRHLCTPSFIAFFSLGMLLVSSLFSRTAFLLFLTETFGLAALYVYTWSLAKKVTIRRLLSSRQFRELDVIDVVLEIRNRSDSSLTGLIVEDRFGCAQKIQVREAPESVRPRSMLRFTYKRTCDGGMGTHRIGPLMIRMMDPLGIFEFRIIEDTVLEIQVYPRVEKVSDLPVRASIESARYGNYEVASRGLSVNFSGVRQYESGDSLRHIAWKLSGRGAGLLVKEFEKVVNCDVNVVLNLALPWQVGRHSSSTWECAKDVALTVLQQQLDLGNTVGFFSDSSYIEPGVGSDHFHTLARHVAGLDVVSRVNDMPLDSQSPLEKYRSLFPRGSNVFYITSFNCGEMQQSEPQLRRLAADGFNVCCVFIDSSSFWVQFVESISTGLMAGAKFTQGLDELVAQLKRDGIQTYTVKYRQALRDAFKNRAPVVERR